MTRAVEWLDGDKITAAKLNAMQDYLIEGDYTSYKYVWGRNYTGIANNYIYIYRVSNTGTVTFTDWDQETLWKKTYSGAESSTGDLAGVYGVPNAERPYTSVLGTYYALADYTDEKVFHIFKDDNIIQSIDITDDDATSDAVMWSFPVVFSPNGRYFALVSEVVGSSYGLYLTLYEADV